jgi:Glycine zipper
MIRKTVIGLAAALALAGALCNRAPAQTYPYYQSSPTYQSQYPSQYPPYQQQYAPYQQQYAPTQQYAPAQQYAPQQQYAPPQSQAAYGELPEHCRMNNAATGAIVGSLFGAAIGGALGGGRGAALGAGSGALFGGMSGAQADAQCQQLAVQRAYQRAAAQQAAYEQMLAQQAARQSGPLTLPAAAYEPVTEEYATPSNGHQHRITVKRLNSYAEPATKRVCDNFTKIDSDLTGNTATTVSARRCKGADGVWRDA